MTTLKEQINIARSNIRPDEALLTRIVSQLPEKKQTRVLVSPYVTYFFTSLVSVYALFIVALPLLDNYQAYRATGTTYFDSSLLLTGDSQMDQADIFNLDTMN